MNKFCIVCNNKIISEKFHPKRIYCSKFCYKQQRLDYNKQYYMIHKKPSNFHKKEPSKCEICGKILHNRRNKKCILHNNQAKAKDLNFCKKLSIRVKESWKRLEVIKKHSGKNNPMFGKIIHGKYQKYNNIGMRSGFEVAFAKWCDKNKIKWQYEPKTFDLGETTYTPDFYLSEFNLYIEVKGWWRDDAKKKFNLFKQIYCGERIKILDKKELKLGGIL